MSDIILEVNNVSKRYRLGQYGVTTLREELQRLFARAKGAEDPTASVGGIPVRPGETFLALDGVSFSVRPGEKLGIIGRNGAGKSTLLKLISRITAPTGGTIGINGRVASMLEVGTGFHPELTGRENIYMNGAILGMTKREIDGKIEDIIEFSECRAFIDTPVKRYSSGMYVKLAFAVAAHLDCEIMIMDEVLAVGDMAFQQKCLEKMSEVSANEGRTVLYVSHNMNTIRRLCDRCIVLSEGKLVFDGEVEKAIEKYAGMLDVSPERVEFSRGERKNAALLPGFVFKSMNLSDRPLARYETGEKMRFFTTQDITEDIASLRFRTVVYSADGGAVTSFATESDFAVDKNTGNISFTADISALSPGRYTLRLGAYLKGEYGKPVYFDTFDRDLICFEVIPARDFNGGEPWDNFYRGHVVGAPLLAEIKKD